MNKWRLRSYSLCLATVVTAVSFAIYSSGGEFLVWPGLVMEVLINGLLLLLVPTGDDYLALPHYAFLIFNVTFYACIFYLFHVLIQKLRVSNR